jgi:hypothetical protein
LLKLSVLSDKFFDKLLLIGKLFIVKWTKLMFGALIRSLWCLLHIIRRGVSALPLGD